MIANCRNYFQAALKALNETGEPEDSPTRQKVALLGKAPDLLHTAVLDSVGFMEQAITTMHSCAKRIADSGGLNSFKDVRVQYRSQDGLTLFRHVKELSQVNSHVVM